MYVVFSFKCIVDLIILKRGRDGARGEARRALTYKVGGSGWTDELTVQWIWHENAHFPIPTVNLASMTSPNLDKAVILTQGRRNPNDPSMSEWGFVFRKTAASIAKSIIWFVCAQGGNENRRGRKRRLKVKCSHLLEYTARLPPLLHSLLVIMFMM